MSFERQLVDVLVECGVSDAEASAAKLVSDGVSSWKDLSAQTPQTLADYILPVLKRPILIVKAVLLSRLPVQREPAAVIDLDDADDDDEVLGLEALPSMIKKEVVIKPEVKEAKEVKPEVKEVKVAMAEPHPVKIEASLSDQKAKAKPKTNEVKEETPKERRKRELDEELGPVLVRCITELQRRPATQYPVLTLGNLLLAHHNEQLESNPEYKACGARRGC